MTAKCEVNQIGAGWVFVIEKDPVVRRRQGNSVAALPSTWGQGENFSYYTEGQEDTLVEVIPDEKGKGCFINGEKLEAGTSIVIGNLKITGA